MDEELKNLIKSVSEFKVEELIKKEKEFNFVDIGDLIKDLIDRISSLKQHPEYFTTITDINPIKNLISQLYNVFQRIKEFDATKSPNPVSERSNLINHVKNLNNDLENLILQRYQLYLDRKNPKRDNIRKLEDQLNSKIKIFEEKEEEMDRILKSVREKVGEIGITEYEKVFDDEAISNKKAAYIWLLVSILIFAVSVYLFIKLFLYNNSNLTTSNTLYDSVNRTMFLAIVGYALFQSVKNYNARMHLYLKNLHRRNCLRVFDKIRNSAFDNGTKDEILKFASKTIFESGETGFIQNSEDSKGYGTINIIDKVEKSLKK